MTSKEIEVVAQAFSQIQGCGCCAEPSSVVGQTLRQIFTDDQIDKMLGQTYWRN